MKKYLLVILQIMLMWNIVPHYPINNGNKIYLAYTPNDPKFDEAHSSFNPYPYVQWSLHAGRVDHAWNYEVGSTYSNVMPCIIDTGINIDHEELDNIAGMYDFTNHEVGGEDTYGHGTHVAGIIGAETDNSKGIAGIAGGDSTVAGNSLFIAKISDDGNIDNSDAAEAIMWCANQVNNYPNRRIIINISWGSLIKSGQIEDAIDWALAKNALIVAAAGNGCWYRGEDGCDFVMYPARHPGVIGVNNVDTDLELHHSSNWGDEVGVTAPGTNVYSTYIGSDSAYQYLSGTSMATPYVVGVLALMWTLRPELSANIIKWILYTNVVDLGYAGFDEYYGHGFVDAYLAVLATISYGKPHGGGPGGG